MFDKIEWDNIISKAFYRRPGNLNNVIFDLKDFTTSELIEVKNCGSTNLSGALTEVIHIQNFPVKKDNILTFIFKNIANIFITFPLNFIFKKFKFAEELSYYAILD